MSRKKLVMECNVQSVVQCFCVKKDVPVQIQKYQSVPRTYMFCRRRRAGKGEKEAKMKAKRSETRKNDKQSVVVVTT